MRLGLESKLIRLMDHQCDDMRAFLSSHFPDPEEVQLLLDVFQRERYTVERIAHLSQEDLTSMGVPRGMHRPFLRLAMELPKFPGADLELLAKYVKTSPAVIVRFGKPDLETIVNADTEEFAKLIGRSETEAKYYQELCDAEIDLIKMRIRRL